MAFYDKAICGQAFIGLYDDNVADLKRTDGNFFGGIATAHQGRLGGKLCQCFNGALGAAHGILFQCVANGE